MSSVLCPGLLAHPPPLVEGLAALMCNDNLCLSSWLQTAFKGLHHLAFLWLLNTARIPLEGVGGVLGRREQGRRALSSHHSLKSWEGESYMLGSCSHRTACCLCDTGKLCPLGQLWIHYRHLPHGDTFTSRLEALWLEAWPGRCKSSSWHHREQAGLDH